MKINLDNRSNISNPLQPAPKAPERNYSNFPTAIPSTSGTGRKPIQPNLPDCENSFLSDFRKNSIFNFKDALLSPIKSKSSRKTAKDFFLSNDESNKSSNSDMESDIPQMPRFEPPKTNVKKGLKTKKLSDKDTNEENVIIITPSIIRNKPRIQKDRAQTINAETQTDTLIPKDLISSFIKELTKMLYIKGADIIFKCNPVANIANDYFGTSIDGYWLHNAMQ